MQDAVGFEDLLYDDHIGKLSLVGAGMRSHPGVSATFFAALADAGVNVEMISTSEIRISVVCRDTDLDVAVRAVHDAFELGSRGRAGRRLRRHRPMTALDAAIDRLRSASSARPGRSARVMRRILAERDFPVDEIRFFASARSAGTTLPWEGVRRPSSRTPRPPTRPASTSRCSPPAPRPRRSWRRSSPRPARP